MARAKVIFIIGMMRSGTSALARTLSLCGCNLPHAVLGSQKFNPTGNWDPIEALKLNAQFMAPFGAMLGDPTMRFHEQLNGLAGAETERFVERIQEFLDGCPKGAPLVIKDQWITELLPYWVEATRRSGMTATSIIPVRHPGDVYASLTRVSPNNLPREYACVIWLKYNLIAVRAVRQLPHIFVEYPRLMKDWRAEISRISQAFDVHLRTDEPSVDTFLNPSLCHFSAAAPFDDLPLAAWCRRAYELQSEAAQDRGLDPLAIDQIYEQFSSVERTLRIAQEYFSGTYEISEVAAALNRMSVIGTPPNEQPTA